MLALTALPVSQLPDIVPPQVQVSAVYPGASAAVLEATVAQPIGSQGRRRRQDDLHEEHQRQRRQLQSDRQLRARHRSRTSIPSTSTTACRPRCRNLPPEVQVQGLTVQKRSSSILQFISLYSEGGKLDPLFITNYATINVLDELSRTPGVGQATLFGRLDYSMRIWFDTDAADQPRPCAIGYRSRRCRHKTFRLRSAASARSRSPTTSNSSSMCRPRDA